MHTEFWVNSLILRVLNFKDIIINLSDYRRGFDWWFDLFTTYTLVTTLYRSLTHTDYYPQSIIFFISRFLSKNYNTLTELHTELNLFFWKKNPLACSQSELILNYDS
jgi:hypothetical protein